MLDRLEGQADRVALDNARLLVSELIANAVEHVAGDDAIGLRIDLRNGRLRVEVRDSGPGFEPAPRRPDHPEDSGWGLHFVRLLADRWAVDREDGSRVWFEIDTRPAAAA